MSYQLRRVLGETQEGGGAISEVFRAASRIDPGDAESWHREWLRLADSNRERGYRAEEHGHVTTAIACWLRAANYYRSAEFWLSPDDPRRLDAFGKCEECFQSAGTYFYPPLETVHIPYEDDHVLYAYFLRAPRGDIKQPVLISFGGLDSFKEELFFMIARGALSRGISCLLVDGPGQGGTLRRQGVHPRYDYEVPVARCIDYLETRQDVDLSRLAVSGSSTGGYYAARAACFEPRLAGAISHGPVWDAYESFADCVADHGDSHPLAPQFKWVFDATSMAEVREKLRLFSLSGIVGRIKCPYLIVQGEVDTTGVKDATRVFEEAHSAGVPVTLRLVSAEETGADHCQHDNPTIGQELMCDWLAEQFGIDERLLASRMSGPSQVSRVAGGET